MPSLVYSSSLGAGGKSGCSIPPEKACEIGVVEVRSMSKPKHVASSSPLDSLVASSNGTLARALSSGMTTDQPPASPLVEPLRKIAISGDAGDVKNPRCLVDPHARTFASSRCPFARSNPNGGKMASNRVAVPDRSTRYVLSSWSSSASWYVARKASFSSQASEVTWPAPGGADIVDLSVPSGAYCSNDPSL